jgi:tetratricopeptide (TPR) repeat protein
MLGLGERAAGARDLFRREFPGDRRSASLRREEPAPAQAREVRRAPVTAPAAPEPGPDPRRTAIQLWGEGLKHHKAGELDAAIEWYRKALLADGKLVTAHYNLGLAYRQKNDNIRARDSFTAALGLSPQMHDARYMLASCYWSLGDNERAAAEALKILQIDDGHANAHLLLGIVYREKNLPAQARPHLERYLRLDPNGQMADQVRGWIRDMR